jgi:signal transduction histidine kinase
LLLEVTASDLREICRSVLDEFEPGRARFEAEGDVTGVWDPDRLAQVVSNIVGNGIEHAAPGTMVAVKAFADGEAVVTEISNQGPTIPAELLPFIFRPFRRAGDRVPSKSGNMGLGLFIAHEIVVAHGGTLEARSLRGTTTFVVRLPRRAPTGGG